MRICIVSDSHDRAQSLVAAAEAARAEQAEVMIHCGDVIGANTVRPLMKMGMPMHVVHGNNAGDPLALRELAYSSNGSLHYYGQDATITLSGRRIFMTHMPHYGRAFACTGEYDLVCYGHTHEAALEQERNVKGGMTWLVNPGTVAGLGAPATWVLGDLASMHFEIRAL